MLNQIQFYTNNDKIDYAMDDARTLFGETIPYKTTHTLNGNVYVFTDHFILTIRAALTADCIGGMSFGEAAVWDQFVSLQNKGTFRNILSNKRTVEDSLDEWIFNLVTGNEDDNPSLNSCNISNLSLDTGYSTPDYLKI